jgi:hypothetical protein
MVVGVTLSRMFPTPAYEPLETEQHEITKLFIVRRFPSPSYGLNLTPYTPERIPGFCIIQFRALGGLCLVWDLDGRLMSGNNEFCAGYRATLSFVVRSIAGVSEFTFTPAMYTTPIYAFSFC